MVYLTNELGRCRSQFLFFSYVAILLTDGFHPAKILYGPRLTAAIQWRMPYKLAYNNRNPETLRHLWRGTPLLSHARASCNSGHDSIHRYMTQKKNFGLAVTSAVRRLNLSCRLLCANRYSTQIPLKNRKGRMRDANGKGKIGQGRKGDRKYKVVTRI